jgi:hypothetical protein
MSTIQGRSIGRHQHDSRALDFASNNSFAQGNGLRSLALAFGALAISLFADGGVARAADAAGRHSPVGTSASGSVETVYFAGGQMPVKVVRGGDPTGTIRMRVETRSFGDGTGNRVTVLRGIIEPIAAAGAGSVAPGVLVFGGRSRLRGSPPVDLFGLSHDEQFNRIATAVHGVESRYGADARMWRLDNLDGPQGPMQVSAAAAFDVGGGNRFDLYENLLLGRAYLARLFWRYNSWPDALAAYNWGPGNVDQWIARGRKAVQLPAETTRYVALVLRRALVEPIAETVQ